MEGELQLDFFKVCCNQNHSMILCHGITVMICYALLHTFHGNYIVTMLYPVFSSHMLHEVFSSSCCSTHSKCSYKTISLSLDKFRLTLPFLPKKRTICFRSAFPVTKTCIFTQSLQFKTQPRERVRNFYPAFLLEDKE